MPKVIIWRASRCCGGGHRVAHNWPFCRQNVQVGAIDFSRLKDGVYPAPTGRGGGQRSGEGKSGRVSDIRVTKDVMFPKPEWTEQTMKSVIERQTLQVDVISGATVTMKAYLKSIENALEKAK